MRQAASTGVPCVDQFAGAGGDAQLVAGVAAVTALGAQRGDQPGLADGPQEAGRGADHLRGAAHRVGGVVVVVESVGGLAGVLWGTCTSRDTRRGAPVRATPGPRGLSTPSTGTAAPASYSAWPSSGVRQCGYRGCVTGDHLPIGACGTRAELNPRPGDPDGVCSSLFTGAYCSTGEAWRPPGRPARHPARKPYVLPGPATPLPCQRRASSSLPRITDFRKYCKNPNRRSSACLQQRLQIFSAALAFDVAGRAGVSDRPARPECRPRDRQPRGRRPPSADTGVPKKSPHPVPGVPALPVAGARRPLTTAPDGTYTVTDPDTGHTRTFTPEPDDPGLAQLTEIRDRAGHWITFDHDDAGAPLSIRHSAGYRLLITSTAAASPPCTWRAPRPDGADRS